MAGAGLQGKGPWGLLQRAETWIIFFLLLRLVGITHAPLETAHNWRQATGLMVARNFVETDPNILFPRTDETMGKTGIVALEFPLLNYLHAILSWLFGYTHWYGRLINLLVTSLGMLFFHRLLARYFDQRLALYATLLLIGSLWFSYSRKMMPDTFSLSLMFTGLWFASNYLLKGGMTHLLLFTVLGALGLLAKIPAGIYLVVLLPMVVVHREPKRVAAISLAGLLIAAAGAWWYFIWNPMLSEVYGQWYNSGKPILQGLREVMSYPGDSLEKVYFSSFKGYVGPILALAGLVLAIRKKDIRILFPLLLVSLLFMVYVFKSGDIYAHHTYYILPFVPVMAILAAYLLRRVPRQWISLLLLVVCITESIANQYQDFVIREDQRYKLALESIADEVSTPEDLVAINGNGNPQQLYLSHRKGWVCEDRQLTDTAYIDHLVSEGCRYLFIDRHSFGAELGWEEVFRSDDYLVYDLRGPS